MIRLYKALIVLIFMYATGHMGYTFFNKDAVTPEEKMWFFSGGIALLLMGFINILHFILHIPLTRNICFITNLAMLLFMIILCFIIPEPQVIVLDFILATILITAWKHAVTVNKRSSYEVNLPGLQL
ncbi:hypothetical protein ECE50_002470 [Chitinophaga sp. Mgbs1]|uniref:Uncharacterized protein n=1 Tax=Chitinophaga solisilvae TaxID=1233460 RepID=A0A433WQ96_9BACT|nr:hypothetical protein [Chitinophaga solisilvae]